MNPNSTERIHMQRDLLPDHQQTSNQNGTEGIRWKERNRLMREREADLFRNRQTFAGPPAREWFTPRRQARVMWSRE